MLVFGDNGGRTGSGNNANILVVVLVMMKRTQYWGRSVSCMVGLDKFTYKLP